METEFSVFDVLKKVVLWLSPLVFLEGMFLVLFKADKQLRLEEFLNQKIGLRRKLVPEIEKNIYSVHNWLMNRTSVIGIFFIVYSVLIFIVLLHYC